MKKIIILIFYCFLFPIKYSIIPEYGNVIVNEKVYNQPFLGGFNKPKIQWVDWNNDQIEDLFILDEDWSIRHYQNNESSDYELINNKLRIFPIPESEDAGDKVYFHYYLI